MLSKPPEPILGSIDGDSYHSLRDYDVSFGDWLHGLEFTIYASTITDIASIPWWLRSIHDRASLGLTAPFLHDFLCTQQGKFINKDGVEVQLSWFDVHLFFLVAMRLDGIHPARAFLAFIAVLLGNRPSWEVSN